MSLSSVVPEHLLQALNAVIPQTQLTRQQLPQTTIDLWLIPPDLPTERMDDEVIRRIWNDTPYWIFCWASGLAMAQWLLAEPWHVKDKVVLDFGAGSGVVAIAAKLAGAKRVIACDIDLISLDGVYKAATMGSETTAAAVGQQGIVRRDPFAMLPFSGYNMGDYFQHWLNLGEQLEKSGAKLPKIFNVNWFRRDENGDFIWPGFGQNMRVLQWMIDRCEDRVEATETPIGYVPSYDQLNWTGSDFTAEQFAQVTTQSADQWTAELDSHLELFDKIGSRLPEALRTRREALVQAVKGEKVA
jgi:hypothetical protein